MLRQKIEREFEGEVRWTKYSYVKLKKDYKKGKKAKYVKRYSSKIRYYAVGEYGDMDRPHYHILLFNAPLEYFRYNSYFDRYFSFEIEEIWKKGLVHIGKVEPASVHYCTKYHLLTPDDWRKDDCREKPFSVQSRKPGIGENYIDTEIIDYFNSSKDNYATLSNGKRIPLGRYYKNKIREKSENIEDIRETKKRAIQRANKQEEVVRNTFHTEADFFEFEREVNKNGRKKYERMLKKNKGKL